MLCYCPGGSQEWLENPKDLFVRDKSKVTITSMIGYHELH